jgi:TRAP-type mannitol/chloroaromatic compound transport system permease small subunit
VNLNNAHVKNEKLYWRYKDMIQKNVNFLTSTLFKNNAHSCCFCSSFFFIPMLLCMSHKQWKIGSHSPCECSSFFDLSMCYLFWLNV